MSTFLAVLIALAAMWFVWRFVRTLFKPRQPAEPIDDLLAFVREPRKRPPKGRSAAVAVEEPEDDSYRSFPPRR